LSGAVGAVRIAKPAVLTTRARHPHVGSEIVAVVAVAFVRRLIPTGHLVSIRRLIPAGHLPDLERHSLCLVSDMTREAPGS
jgi:hypothetical protein